MQQNNLLGVFWQDKLGLKKMENAFLSKDPQIPKSAFEVWNNQILAFFPVFFSKGTQEKLIGLENESDIFMQNWQIYNFRIPIA